MGGRVIVIGSVNIDLVVTTDRLPLPGETVTGGTFARHHGGTFVLRVEDTISAMLAERVAHGQAGEGERGPLHAGGVIGGE